MIRRHFPHILAITIGIFFAAQVLGSALSGTNVAAPIRPFDSQDTYPTHVANEGKGGAVHYQLSTQMYSRPTFRNSSSMTAYVAENDTTYRWSGVAWVLVPPGSAHGIKNTAGDTLAQRSILRCYSGLTCTDAGSETRMGVPFANQTTAGLMKTTDRKALSSYVFGVEHGMVCNGSVDDTTSFQTAINAATGATLMLPSRGDCKIASYVTLVNDITIDLNSSRLSFIGGSGECIRSSGKSNIIIRNGETYVPDGTRFTGYFSNSNNVEVDNVRTVLSPKGFYFTNCSTATVRNSKIQFALNDKSSYSLGVWTDSASTKIVNNDFDYNGSWGDAVLIAPGAFDTQILGGHMRGGTNTVDDSLGSSGIYSSSNPGERRRIQISGVDIHDVSGNGIDLAGDAYEVTMTGNQIARTGEAGIGIFNVAGSYPRWVTISGGQILNSGQNGALVINSHAGIVIDGADNVTVKGVHIADTQTSKTQTYPVQLVNAPTSVRIIGGNTFTGHLTGDSVNGTPGAVYAQKFNNINSTANIIIEGEGATFPGFTTLHYGNSGQPTNLAQRARGTIASPTAILDGDNMFSFVEYGHDGTSFVQSGLFALQAVGDFSGTNAGSKWLFQATPENTTTPTTILTVDGNGAEVASGKRFSGSGSVPTETGNSGKYLTNDGTSSSWGEIPGLQLTKVTSGTIYIEPTDSVIEVTTAGAVVNVGAVNKQATIISNTSAGNITLQTSSVSPFPTLIGSPITLAAGKFVVIGEDPDNANTNRVVLTGSNGGSGDHGALTGLADDDHSQYALLAGRSGTNAFTGNITATGSFGSGVTSPSSAFHAEGTTLATSQSRWIFTGASGAASGGGVNYFTDDGAAIASGDRLGYVIFGGARDNAHTISSSAGIAAYGNENWSGTTSGSKLYFQTTVPGESSVTRAERLVIDGKSAYFANGGGLPSGNMYSNTSTTITVASSGTWYEVDTGATDFTAGQLTGVTHSDHYLVVPVAGKYVISARGSAKSGAAGDEMAISVMVNGTAQESCHGHTTAGSATTTENLGCETILSLAANDQISLAVQNHTAARNITLGHMSLVLHHVAAQ